MGKKKKVGRVINTLTPSLPSPSAQASRKSPVVLLFPPTTRCAKLGDFLLGRMQHGDFPYWACVKCVLCACRRVCKRVGVL